MRFFIALEIPEESRKHVADVQDKLKEVILQVKLTNLEKLHLTIAFIGEQEDSLKDNLIEILRLAVKNIPPFEVTPAYIDGFPNLHHAQIFWLGVKGDIDKLMLVRERIKDGLVNLGLPVDERRYIPHIALAKIFKFTITPHQEEKLQAIITNFQPIQINSIKLFESIPQEGFHTHNTLAEIALELTNK